MMGHGREVRTGDVLLRGELALPRLSSVMLHGRFRSLSLFCLLCCLTFAPVAGRAQVAGSGGSLRKVRISPHPEYPELARKLSIRGVVQLWVKVTAEGTVREVNVVGGNPILVDSCVNTVKKWRYEPTGKESLEPVRFNFD
jgi:TonB family protein